VIERHPALAATPLCVSHPSRRASRWRLGLLLILLPFAFVSCEGVRYLLHSLDGGNVSDTDVHQNPKNSDPPPEGWQEVRLDTISIRGSEFAGMLTAWARASGETATITINGHSESREILVQVVPYPVTKVIITRLPVTIRFKGSALPHEFRWEIAAPSQWSWRNAGIAFAAAALLYLGVTLFRAGVFRPPRLKWKRVSADPSSSRERAYVLNCWYWKRTEFFLTWSVVEGDVRLRAYWTNAHTAKTELTSDSSETPTRIPHHPPPFAWLRPARCRTATNLYFEFNELPANATQVKLIFSAHWPATSEGRELPLTPFSDTFTVQPLHNSHTGRSPIERLWEKIDQLEERINSLREQSPKLSPVSTEDRSRMNESINWRIFTEELRNVVERQPQSPPPSYTREEKFLAAINEWWSARERTAENLLLSMSEAGFASRICRLGNIEDQVRAETLMADYVFETDPTYWQWLVAPLDAGEREVFLAPISESFHSDPTALDILLTLFECPGSQRPSSVQFSRLLRPCKVQKTESSSSIASRYRVATRGFIEFSGSGEAASSLPRPPAWESVLRSMYPERFRNNASRTQPEVEETVKALRTMVDAAVQKSAQSGISALQGIANQIRDLQNRLDTQSRKMESLFSPPPDLTRRLSDVERDLKALKNKPISPSVSREKEPASSLTTPRQTEGTSVDRPSFVSTVDQAKPASPSPPVIEKPADPAPAVTVESAAPETPPISPALLGSPVASPATAGKSVSELIPLWQRIFQEAFAALPVGETPPAGREYLGYARRVGHLHRHVRELAMRNPHLNAEHVGLFRIDLRGSLLECHRWELLLQPDTEVGFEFRFEGEGRPIGSDFFLVFVSIKLPMKKWLVALPPGPFNEKNALGVIRSLVDTHGKTSGIIRELRQFAQIELETGSQFRVNYKMDVVIE